MFGRALHSDFPSAATHLAGLMNTLVNIWQMSNYYNTRQRLVFLLQALSQQIVDGAVAHAEFEENLLHRSADAAAPVRERLCEIVDLTTLVKAEFRSCAARVKDTTPEHDWSCIDERLAFWALDKVAACHDFLGLLDAVDDFAGWTTWRSRPGEAKC